MGSRKYLDISAFVVVVFGIIYNSITPTSTISETSYRLTIILGFCLLIVPFSILLFKKEFYDDKTVNNFYSVYLFLSALYISYTFAIFKSTRISENTGYQLYTILNFNVGQDFEHQLFTGFIFVMLIYVILSLKFPRKRIKMWE